MVVDIIIAISTLLVAGVVIVTAKFSREIVVNKTFNELWFEQPGKLKEQGNFSALQSETPSSMSENRVSFSKAA